MENGQWLQPGDQLTLAIDQIGHLASGIVATAV